MLKPMEYLWLAAQYRLSPRTEETRVLFKISLSLNWPAGQKGDRDATCEQQAAGHGQNRKLIKSEEVFTRTSASQERSK